MYSSSRSQDDLTPPAPPPSPCHENFRRQPRNDYFAGIAIQLVFNGKRAKKFTVDPPEGGQELSDSDGSSIGASSIFSDHSSNDDNSSIGTEACKEDSADIKRINFRGVIPGGEVPSGDEHSWQPPPMIQYAYSSTLEYHLNDAGEWLRSLLTLHTSLYDSQLTLMMRS
ncbi:hypothetical protein B0A52_05622 [Exophiala mesophila]|uniref:Uncharacterized protein n=1 Tax=Exophiala mesophila TaxID=212818 RepID=A0A438N3N2_EXOME|nr:hypothetical protein B0A52_05622 [Exophiala mesophila]